MSEGIQRWRIAFSRGAPALELGSPEISQAFELAFAEAGVPVVMSTAARPRPRLTFAVGLPPGRVAEHDLLDVVLAERWTLPDLRNAISRSLPAGLEVLDLYDVWPGAPSISAALAATTSRATLGGARSSELKAATGTLLEARTLDRTRAKGAERQTTYDLRPLVLDLEASPTAPVVRMALRTTSEGPAGRPDEVVLALGELLGRDLRLVDLVRERLWTSDESPTLN